MPTWYRLVQGAGYWWHPPCMLVCAAVLVAVPGGTVTGRVAAGLGLGLGLGIVVAPLSGASSGWCVLGWCVLWVETDPQAGPLPGQRGTDAREGALLLSARPNFAR